MPGDSPRGRGQSTVIGFVLMFGVLVLLLLTIQTSAVPAWNQAVEYSHNERVQGEMELLRDDVFRTAATGSTGSESITLGTQYPVRPFLLNPPDPTGTLRTLEPGTVTVTNATATGEAGDYWNGSTLRFTDRHLVYEPNYNEYRNAPTTVYENTVLYNRYGERTRPVTQESLVSGRRITIVTLDGFLSRGGRRPVEAELQALSAPEQVVTVRADGPLVLTFPTTLPEEAWVDLLADERARRGGYVTNVSVSPGDPFGTLRVTLRAGESYDLRMAEVGLGTRLDDPGAHYLATATPAQLQVPQGSAERVVFEVRDRYNNPVSGVRVNATLSGPGTLAPVDPTTGADGHAVFRYEATGAGEATVTATFGGAPGALRTADVAVQSVATGGGGDGVGPLVTGFTTNRTTASGGSVRQGAVLTLSATASDFERGGTDVYAVEWWSNRSAPGGAAGSGFALVPESGDDDEFDSVVEDVRATVDTDTWSVGRHELSVRARDAAGNWGPVETHEVVVTSGGAAAADVTLVDGSASTNNPGNRFSFAVDTGGEAVTLRSASVDTTNVGGVRDAMREVSVDGTDRRSEDGTYRSDGTPVPLTGPVINGTATIRFGNFDNGVGNTRLPSGDYAPRDTPPASGEYLVVTLTFADGSSTTFYFVPP